jgi:hypothetical protein
MPGTPRSPHDPKVLALVAAISAKALAGLEPLDLPSDNAGEDVDEGDVLAVVELVAETLEEPSDGQRAGLESGEPVRQ